VGARLPPRLQPSSLGGKLVGPDSGNQDNSSNLRSASPCCDVRYLNPLRSAGGGLGSMWSRDSGLSFLPCAGQRSERLKIARINTCLDGLWAANPLHFRGRWPTGRAVKNRNFTVRWPTDRTCRQSMALPGHNCFAIATQIGAVVFFPLCSATAIASTEYSLDSA